MRQLYRVLLILSATLVPLAAYSQLALWDFTANTLAPATTDANVTASDAAQVGLTGTTQFFSCSGPAWSPTGWATSALVDVNDDYAEFTITASNTHDLSITGFTFTARRSNSGPTLYTVRSSSDSYASDLVAGSIGTVCESKGGSFSTITVTAGSSISFRLYGYSASGNGNMRMDNITIEGTSILVSTDPIVGFIDATSSVTEGDSGTSTHTVDVQMSLAPDSDTEVDVISSAVTATENDDYDEVISTLTFTTGETYPATKSVTITINGDTDIEPDETFELLLAVSSGGPADEGTDTHTVTITNDDIASVPAIVITEVGDPTDNINQRMVEVCNRGMTTVDITGWALQVDFNGNTTVDATVNVGGSVSLDAGDCYVFANNNFVTSGGDLSSCAGFALSGNISTNGDESFWLFDGSNQIDFYDGQTLDFENSIATRNFTVTEPTSTFAASEWTVQSGNASDLTPCADPTALPVSLTNLTAKAVNNEAHLHWTTAQEQNNSHFIIQRSSNGVRYENIGRVEGIGESSAAVNYQYVDKNPAPGFNYYRLHQFDYDGQNELFGPVTVRFERVGEVAIWPSPTAGLLQVRLPETTAAWQLTITDLNGRVLLQKSVEEKTARTEMDLSTLPAGTYLLRWADETQQGIQRIVKL